MPYKVFQEDGKHKVYKLGADNKPTGKPLGEHTDPGKAAAQVRALYANEKKPKKEAEPTTPGNAVSVTVTQSGEAEDKSFSVPLEETKEAENKDYYGGEMAYAPIGGPTTFADLEAENAAREAAYEMNELTYNFQRLAANIMSSPDTEDKAAALTALASEYAGLVSEKAKLDIEKTIAKQIAGDNQPDKTTKSTSTHTDQQPDTTDAPGGDSELKTTTDTQSLFIWKEGDVYRWLAAYSNNRRDSDNPPEIISTQSHKEFDEALSSGEWPMPELWPWHVPFPVGVADYHAFDESTGFPVAAGHFYKGMDWAAEGMIKAGWNGTSHGMPKDWIARDENDPTIIERHRTKEISPLPTWAAANKLAFTIISKETTMADEKGLPVHKRDEFIKAFGEERVTQIETALADKAKEADDAGIEKKETTTQDTGPVLTRNELKGAFEVILEAINNLEAKTDARFKALEEGTSEKEESFDLVAMLREKSAIGKAETKVDGRSSFAKDAPEEAQVPSASQQTVGVPVGLLDGLFQLNQGWYNGGK